MTLTDLLTLLTLLTITDFNFIDTHWRKHMREIIQETINGEKKIFQASFNVLNILH